MIPLLAFAELPPTFVSLSRRITLAPRSSKRRAVVIPATPVPMTTTSGPVTDGAEGVVVMALAVVVVEEEEGAMEAARMAEVQRRRREAEAAAARVRAEAEARRRQAEAAARARVSCSHRSHELMHRTSAHLFPFMT